MTEEKRTADTVDAYIENLPEELRRIAAELRKIILDASPELEEEYKWSMPNYSYKGMVCYIQTAKNHVNLGFHKGNELESMDAGELLQGSGKTMRHVRVKRMEDIEQETVAHLVKEAVKLDENVE